MQKNVRLMRFVVSIFFVVALTIFGFSKLTLLSETPIASAQTNTNTKPQTQTAPQSEQDKILAGLRKSIEGKEQQPAEQVWKNIQLFKGRPAASIPAVMNAFSRALGVSCSHCHVVGEWEKEDLPTKQIARDMMNMVNKINGEHLKNIKNISGKTPVSCSTCHRGQTIPDGRLPEPKKAS